MANYIIMPKVGVDMEEGTVNEWKVKEGDSVKKGDMILEIETDKSAMDLESDYEGTILKILYEEGAELPVVTPIAIIGEPGEDISEMLSNVPKSSGSEIDYECVVEERFEPIPDEPVTPPAVVSVPEDVRFIKATPAARYLAKTKNLDLAGVQPSGRSGEIVLEDVETALAGTKATPLAGRIAASKGIDLAGVDGSGHGGKVTKGDLAGIGSAAAQSYAPQAAVADTRVKLTKIEKITGKRMLQSHQEIPSVTENIRIDVTEMLSVRKRINETLENKITINDFVLAALVKAIKENPRVNSVLDGDEMIYKGSVHLGLAVATEKGLVVPVLRDTQNLSLSSLSAVARDAAVRGREGTLLPDELSGSTFTVSNVGMFGINSFSPIINQPEAAILGVCAIEDQLKLDGEKVVNTKVLGLSLTFDHRIIDGAVAAVFLKCLKDYLESPLTVLV